MSLARRSDSPSSCRSVSAELAQLYARHWRPLASLLRRHRDLSNPVLLDLPPRFAQQAVRILVVGQESGPGRWFHDFDARAASGRLAVRTLMRRYAEFAIGTVSGSAHFWRAIRRIESQFGIEAGQVAWTNLNKCDLDGRRPGALENQLHRVFPVLQEELRIIRPEAVIFLTGPRYDALLQRELTADLEVVGPDWPLSVFARVRSPGVLPISSFRTYHPNYLLRFRKPLCRRLLQTLHGEVQRALCQPTATTTRSAAAVGS